MKTGVVEPRQLVTADPESAEAPSLVSECLKACSRREICCCLSMGFVSWARAVDRGSAKQLCCAPGSLRPCWTVQAVQLLHVKVLGGVWLSTYDELPAFMPACLTSVSRVHPSMRFPNEASPA